ncbi:sensor domain-containing diguanylate cyclase [Halomonas saccharevitans]|uniref:diguanylate cyclase n=1 Tax=Halomonas saccharevitans TaxID=416872 RepID=A0A1I7BZE0_9GAMM|nr:diguanylate cyclase [Halomonas saccharevitans]SFT92541.1 PAS domain S-box-containing protein/diguanylate cyclase (GGDEF) domain-containing protein [Halomonas saccharevitans]
MISPSWREEVLTLARTVHLQVDRGGRVLDAIGDTDSLLGEPREGLIGRPLHELTDPRVRLAATLIEQLSARPTEPGQTRVVETDACGVYALANGNVALRLTAQAADDDGVIRRLADRLPVMVAYVDPDGCFRLNNQAYLDFIGLSREALYGQPVSSVLDEASYAKVAPRFRRALAGEEVKYEDRLTLTDGRTYYFKVHYVPDYINAEVAGFYAIIQDISEYGAMIQLLRDVHTGINRTDIGTREIVERLLDDALAYLSLEIGLISHIEDERYTIWWAASRGPEIAPGTTFPLGDTYCRLMLDEADVFHTVRAGEDPRISGHPCYRTFGLESYIGIPLRVDGQVWGTLNFSSTAPRGRPFSEIEEELLRLIANAAERVITHEVEFDRVRRERDHMANRAMTDHLTGLPNRSALERHIERLMQARADGAPPFSLAVLDIDHFKVINDTHGHDIGDRVLCWLAERMAQCLRDGDIVARTGGEEFVIVMPGASQRSAREIVERVRTHVRHGRVTLDDGQTLSVTVSGGIGEHQPGEPYPDLFRRTDTALYAAKRAGRDRTHLAACPA